jgi:hypothetical protein
MGNGASGAGAPNQPAQKGQSAPNTNVPRAPNTPNVSTVSPAPNPNVPRPRNTPNVSTVSPTPNTNVPRAPNTPNVSTVSPTPNTNVPRAPDTPNVSTVSPAPNPNVPRAPDTPNVSTVSPTPNPNVPRAPDTPNVSTVSPAPNPNVPRPPNTPYVNAPHGQKAAIGAVASPSADNLKRRGDIGRVAEEIAGDSKKAKTYSYEAKKDNFEPQTNKCNKFCYDVANIAGAKPPTVKDAETGKVRQASARELASGESINHWRMLRSNENPQTGDIAAYQHRYADAGGHSAIIIVDKAGQVFNIAAHSNGVSIQKGTITPPPGVKAKVVYRRYTGD